MRALAAIWLLTLSACSVNVEGARCNDDSNCPNDQRCNTTTQKCVACVSDPECTDVGQACSGNGTELLQCARNSGSCLYSVRTTCSAGCSAQKCNCPQNFGPDYYADAVASGATGLYGTPTGVSDPADCRFKTVTEVLNAANLHGSGSRAIVTGGSDQNPMVFSAGETFPLEVKPGVTLTTSDATPTPARYVIEVAAADPNRPVVQLDEDAAVAGFTIRPAGSGSASEAVHVKCTSAGASSVSVNGMVLDGKGSLVASTVTEGLHIQDGCNVSVGSIASQNAIGTGIKIESSGTANVSIVSSVLRTNGDSGLVVNVNASSGTPILNLTGNEITRNFAATDYSFGGYTRRAGGIVFLLAPPVLTFTSNSVHGNQYDQILVYSGSTWNIAGDGSECATKANALTCYDSSTASGPWVGLSIIGNASVYGQYNSWAQDLPESGKDYVYYGSGTVTASPSCAKSTLGCP